MGLFNIIKLVLSGLCELPVAGSRLANELGGSQTRQAALSHRFVGLTVLGHPLSTYRNVGVGQVSVSRQKSKDGVLIADGELLNSSTARIGHVLSNDGGDQPALGILQTLMGDGTQVERHRSKVRPAELALPVEMDNAIILERGQVAVDFVEVCATTPRQNVIIRAFLTGWHSAIMVGPPGNVSTSERCIRA